MDDKPVTPQELAAVAADVQAYLSWARDAGLHELGSGARHHDAGAPAARPPAASQAAPVAGPGAPRVPPRPAPPSSPRAPVDPAAPPAAAPSVARTAAAGAPSQSSLLPTPPSFFANVPTVPKSSLPLPTLESVRAEIGECTRCKLHKGRTRLVYGVGSPQARLVFVGEAPGEDEDLQGEPFVGKAGQLLTKMIQAMGLQRSDVYICNTVKCRPPNNRNPEPDELASCEPFLVGQLASLKPEAIVTLGKFAAQALLRDQSPISRLRGSWREYQGIPLMPTFHPAYLLRSPGEKGKVWSDLQQVMKKLDLQPKGGSA